MHNVRTQWRRLLPSAGVICCVCFILFFRRFIMFNFLQCCNDRLHETRMRIFFSNLSILFSWARVLFCSLIFCCLRVIICCLRVTSDSGFFVSLFTILFFTGLSSFVMMILIHNIHYYLYSTIASILMCEITGVKRNRLNYIVITQTLFYNYPTRTSLKSFSF